MPPHTADSPAKKQSKWSPEEDALIIELRGSGMKWEDISKRLPGRSAISCRLHYQNYLERRSEWDEERKNKLARLYERFKPEMWAKVAEEMQVPWRAAEAMHWQLGEQEMARRAGVVPFSLTAQNPEASHQRGSPSRGHHHSQSQGSIPRDVGGGRYGGRGGGGPPPGMPPGMGGPPPMAPMGRPLAAARRDLGGGPPRPMSQYEASDMMMYGAPPPQSYGQPPPGHGHPGPGPGLAPIHTAFPPPPQGRPGTLPGVLELTTGVSPYSTPAYSAGVPSASPVHSQTASPGPFPPAIAPYGGGGGGGGGGMMGEPSGPGSTGPPGGGGVAKRRASPDLGGRESSRRRPPPGDGR